MRNNQAQKEKPTLQNYLNEVEQFITSFITKSEQGTATRKPPQYENRFSTIKDKKRTNFSPSNRETVNWAKELRKKGQTFVKELNEIEQSSPSSVMKERKAEEQGYVHSEDNSGVEEQIDRRGSDVSMDNGNSNDKDDDLRADEKMKGTKIDSNATKHARKSTSVITPDKSTITSVQPIETQEVLEQIDNGEKKFECKECGEVFTHG